MADTKKWCYEHCCIHFCMDTCFCFSYVTRSRISDNMVVLCVTFWCLLSCVQLFATLWTLACQFLLLLFFFSGQNYWSGLPFLTPGNLPYPGIELVSPALQADSLPLSHWVKILFWGTSKLLSNMAAMLSPIFDMLMIIVNSQNKFGIVPGLRYFNSWGKRCILRHHLGDSCLRNMSLSTRGLGWTELLLSSFALLSLPPRELRTSTLNETVLESVEYYWLWRKLDYLILFIINL